MKGKGSFIERASKFIPIVLTFLLTNGFAIWASNASKDFYDKNLKKIMEFNVPLFAFLYIVSGIYAYYSYRIDEKDKEILDYRAQLDSETKEVWKRFKDLSRYRLKEEIKMIMEVFVNSNPDVYAIQLYEYHVKNLSRNTLIKVKSTDGYVFDSIDIDLNNIMQINYSIPKSIHNEFNKAIDKLTKDCVNESMNFIQKYTNSIAIKDINKLNEEDCLVFSMVMLMHKEIVYYYKNYNNVQEYIEKQIGRISDEKTYKLLHLKRTGIFEGLLHKDFYIFMHNGNNNKQGRIYFTKPLILKGTNHCFLMSLNRDIIKEEDWDKKVKEVGQSFVELLSEFMKVSEV